MNETKTTSRITVVLSQTRSKNPGKRRLEEEIATALLLEPGIEFAVTPNVYDLSPGDTGLLYLNSVKGHLILLSWQYPRAAHWLLDRNGISGKQGVTLLKSLGEEEDEDSGAPDEEELHGIGPAETLDRHIFCLDLRAYDDAGVYVEEIKRIAKEASIKLVPLTGLQPGSNQIDSKPDLFRLLSEKKGDGPVVLGDPKENRWYPVIDYSRCTNCLECIDFCLFGVYGIDHRERILVENQDNCKRGCPACSRVCPVNAIIFPEHKTPAIAGAPGEGPGGLKIDLSRLFGAPSAIELAAIERDVELVKDGRDAVGLSVGIPKRQSGKAATEKDDLDKLMDELDSLDL
ncbi:MAG TPA: ferredoxin family protein [Blastocatellia bacterium]|nr:ferredoxin family protein [Blastocatellia bacterium]